MSERLSAADLRARLSGALKAPEPPVPTAPTGDLVKDTLARYRTGGGQAPTAPAATPTPQPGRTPAFRKGAEAAAAASEAPAPVARPSGPKPNRYGGKCLRCASWVEAEAGVLTKDGDGKWAVEHQAGGCPASGGSVEQAVAATDAEVPDGFVKITAVTGQTYVGLQPGIYTLEVPSGHRTFRVRVQSTDDDFHPGSTILEHLTGPDNERDYTGFAFLRGTRMSVWSKHKGNQALLDDARTFLADPSKALLSARCIRCNKRLSTPESVKALMGKDCRNKGW